MKKLLASLLFPFITITSFAQVTGAGATFPAPVYFKWAEAYQKETGKQINYQSIGSGGGIKQINAKTVQFGASDVAVKDSDLAKHGQIQFPMVKGGVVVVLNIPGVKTNQLNLSTGMVADIFSGRITHWKEVDASLPDMKITIVHRADSSGTTAVFTGYLSEHSFHFKSEIGAGKSVKWKGQAVAGKGNAGVAAMVAQVKGSIGYVEYAYAKQNNLTIAKLDGIAPTAENFKSDKYKLTAETFIIVYPNANSREVIAFFDWCLKHDEIAIQLDYVPLSAKSKDANRALWKKNNLQ